MLFGFFLPWVTNHGRRMWGHILIVVCVFIRSPSTEACRKLHLHERMSFYSITVQLSQCFHNCPPHTELIPVTERPWWTVVLCSAGIDVAFMKRKLDDKSLRILASLCQLMWRKVSISSRWEVCFQKTWWLYYLFTTSVLMAMLSFSHSFVFLLQQL